LGISIPVEEARHEAAQRLAAGDAANLRRAARNLAEAPLMNEMILYDSKYGHEVGKVIGETVVSRYGHKFRIEGYAVIDLRREVVGTLNKGKFYNVFGELMAVSRTTCHE
jgi:hypothetical protein